VTHPTKRALTCCGSVEPIDLEMLPIVEPLWARGIHTQWCCQGDGEDDATIGFPDIFELDKLAALLFACGFQPIGTSDWTCTVVPRFPLPDRGIVNVDIPRRQLADLVAALEHTATAEPRWDTVAATRKVVRRTSAIWPVRESTPAEPALT
jgi:hypothetical protein